MNDKPRKRRLSLGWVIIAVVLLGLATLAVVNREDVEVGINEAVRYDEFAFTVLSVSSETSVGEDEQVVMTEGLFYIVQLKVANEGSTMVPFHFKNHFATLHDAAGNQLEVSEAATSALNYFSGADPCDKQLRGGESCVTRFVFEAPAALEEPVLRIQISEGGFWKMLDVIFYGDRTIRVG